MAEHQHSRGEGSASDEPHEAYAEAERRLWPSISTAEHQDGQITLPSLP